MSLEIRYLWVNYMRLKAPPRSHLASFVLDIPIVHSYSVARLLQLLTGIEKPWPESIPYIVAAVRANRVVCETAAT